MTAKSDEMIEQFGPAIEGLLEESSIMSADKKSKSCTASQDMKDC